jgi:X-X-X-Leu-X-X-Gly heptad repeat protein
LFKKNSPPIDPDTRDKLQSKLESVDDARQIAEGLGREMVNAAQDISDSEYLKSKTPDKTPPPDLGRRVEEVYDGCIELLKVLTQPISVGPVVLAILGFDLIKDNVESAFNKLQKGVQQLQDKVNKLSDALKGVADKKIQEDKEKLASLYPKYLKQVHVYQTRLQNFLSALTQATGKPKNDDAVHIQAVFDAVQRVNGVYTETAAMIGKTWNPADQQKWARLLVPLGQLILGPSSGDPGSHVSNQQVSGGDPIVYQKGSAQNAFYSDPSTVEDLAAGYQRVQQANDAFKKFQALTDDWVKAFSRVLGVQDE